MIFPSSIIIPFLCHRPSSVLVHLLCHHTHPLSLYSSCRHWLFCHHPLPLTSYPASIVILSSVITPVLCHHPLPMPPYASSVVILSSVITPHPLSSSPSYVSVCFICGHSLFCRHSPPLSSSPFSVIIPLFCHNPLFCHQPRPPIPPPHLSRHRPFSLSSHASSAIEVCVLLLPSHQSSVILHLL